MRSVVLLALAGTVLSTGCGPTCQSTCRRYYAEEQCDSPPVGLSRETALTNCISECNQALAKTGEPPDPNDSRFDPNRVPQPIKPVLTNEHDVAAWMDCVWSFDDAECKTELGRSCARVP